MKKLLLSVLMLGAMQQLFAQAPITSAINPVAGGFTFTKAADTTGVTPGPAGASQNWTFNLTVTGLLSPNSYIAAAGTPYATDFPNANLALNNGGDYSYYIADNNEYTFLGSKSATDSFLFSNPETFVTYPLVFNTPQSDNFVGMLDTISISGTTVALYDGYGTLTINGLTMTNVVRIKRTETSTYTISGFPVSVVITNYSWLQPTSSDVLLSINTVESAFVNSKSVDVSTVFTGVENISQNVADITVQPSIVNNENSNLVISTEKPKNGTAEIYNSLGQIVSQTEFATTGGLNVVALQTKDLSQGLYFVRIKESAGQISKAQKLVVQ